MGRLERTIDTYGFDKIATENGWHRGNINKHQRRVSYYKGPSYIQIGFSRWMHEVVRITWWDSATSRINVWEADFGSPISYIWLVNRILKGKVDPTDLDIMKSSGLY